MKNYEKYADEIRKYEVSRSGYFCNEFIMPYILKKDSCPGIGCEHCHMLQMIWLMDEYKEPETDWSKVAVDTLILVRDSDTGEWGKRHFARYENGIIYAWAGGCTSWTANGNTTMWEYAKLAEEES